MMHFATRLVLVLVLWAGLLPAQALRRTVQGTVRDQLGYVVADAHITVAGAKYEHAAISAADGSFRVEGAPREPLTLAVEAAGFARFTAALAEDKDQLDVVLLPATVSQEVNVTANRVGTIQAETAESVSILSRWELESAAGEAVDDVLRQVPGFSLFRRSDSRTANPTSQGPSLRGVGASGASRVLVLYDDIPLNDPFGGWVYWGRIPREDVSSIEILRGGGSSLYGSGALSGVVNIVPHGAPRSLFSAELSAGTEGTPDLSLASSVQFKSWTLETAGEGFRTGGYVLVPAAQRGNVDTVADSYHGAGQLTVRRKFSLGDLFASSAFYDEARDNGTPLQNNDTQLWQLSSGLNLVTHIASIQLRGYGSGQSYNQTFSSVALNRNSESLVRAQHVPAQQAGGSLILALQLGSRNSLVGGADSRYVRGFSNETVFAASGPTSLVAAGGRQLTSGSFVQDSIRLYSRLLFTIGGRYDNWDNYEAHSRTTPLLPSVKPSLTQFTDQSQHAFSPRGALL
ncbi:MAG TPA: TonB-dependent receptor, partial [Candidatus Angelobacter sp.]